MKHKYFDIAQRSDNKFNVWKYIVDPTYVPQNLKEENIPYIAMRWVIVEVFDTKEKALSYVKRHTPQQRKKYNNNTN